MRRGLRLWIWRRINVGDGPMPSNTLYNPYFGSLLRPLAQCTWYGGVTSTATGRPHYPYINPWLKSTLLLYVGIKFPRTPEGELSGR
ncbi:hypothetical protein B0H66DRAFT_558498 [Apodospora peruviana]|uniref:Uncharacterized protein n=1 Tax=Apodospora peruviana TaxID=516989 RepID=A0AAE0I7B5_9PEZI|nr:hypothetical protein B0H66DRAFT_558498 [Apodospora peruviana]